MPHATVEVAVMQEAAFRLVLVHAGSHLAHDVTMRLAAQTVRVSHHLQLEVGLDHAALLKLIVEQRVVHIERANTIKSRLKGDVAAVRIRAALGIEREILFKPEQLFKFILRNQQREVWN